MMTPTNGGNATALATTQNPGLAATHDFRMGLEPTTLEGAIRLATIIAATKLHGIKTPEEALTRIMYGRSLGMSSMMSVAAVFSFDGKVGLYAAAMHALCLDSPLCERFECIEESDSSVTYAVKRRGGTEQKITWTLDMAKQAELLSKENWRKYPRHLLHARCKSDGARRVFPERLYGMLSREEIMDGEVINAEFTVQAEQPQQLAAAVDYAGIAQALAVKIEKAESKEEARALRDEIKAAKDGGALIAPWLDDVMAAYTSKFVKKKSAEGTPLAPVAAPHVVADAAPVSGEAEG